MHQLRNPEEDFDTPLARKKAIGLVVIIAFGFFIFLLYLAVRKCLDRPSRSVAPLPQNLALAEINNAANV
jgi:hypothetical protein